jgi:hypothetical protein
VIETLFTDRIDPTTGRKLYLAVEPVAPTAEGLSVAADALDALASAFLVASDEPFDAALRSGFVAANEVVWKSNQAAALDRSAAEERILLGVTGVAVDGDAMLIVQAPPSQVLLVQDNQLYALPAFASWQSDTLTADMNGMAASLGSHREVVLNPISTTVASSDVIILCGAALTASLNEAITRSGAAAADLVPALLAGPDVLNAGLDEIAVTFSQGRELAASIYHLGDNLHWLWTAPLVESAPTTAAAADAHPENDIPLDARAADADDHDVSHEVAGRQAGDDLGDASDGLDADGVLEGAGATSWYLDQHAIDQGALNDDSETVQPGHRFFSRLPNREQLHDELLDASERILGRRDPERVRIGDGGRRFLAPGSRSVRVYHSPVVGSLPPEIRARLPRGPRIRLPMRLLSLMIALILAFGGGGLLYSRHEARADRAQEMLGQTDQALAAFAKTDDPAKAKSALSSAQSALAEARDSGAPNSAVSSRQETIDAASDKLLGVVRLQEITRVGTVPTVKGVKPQLLRAGRDVYLLDGGFYQVNPTDRTLTELLAPGMKIGKATVGQLKDATLDNGVIAVTDGKAIYYRDSARARWSRKRIGLIDGKSAWDATICGAFDGSFYMLNRSGGQILKFSADQLSSLPDNWAGQDARTALKDARDMVVDGKIYVLLADGTIQPYYRGAAQDPITFTLQPALSSPRVLYGALDTAFLYVADKSGTPGRIVRFDRQGGQATQYLLPRSEEAGPEGEGTAPFATIDDFVVDEVTGMIYLISGDQIWSATIPSIGKTA